MNIPKVLCLIRPGAQWNLRGVTMADLEWLDQNTTVPTDAEMQAGWAQVQALSYRDQRQQEYPPIGDGLDALVHKENGDPTKWTDYVAACNSVKEKYPKP